MSRSAGPGSPLAFRCARCRLRRVEGVVGRTGRERPYRAPRGSCLGIRSTLVSREYRCSCGHLGWSNHVDLMMARSLRPA